LNLKNFFKKNLKPNFSHIFLIKPHYPPIFFPKGKNKFWYGFKKHISVDMQSGLINKVALTPANITDAKGLKHVLPSSGAIYADKGYCDKQNHIDAKRKGCNLKAILKNNMKNKNKCIGSFITKMRSPYGYKTPFEVFAKITGKDYFLNGSVALMG
jgi:hypothetical protein